MITEKELHYMYELTDVLEPIFVYPYKGNEIQEDVKNINGETIELKIEDFKIKLSILPLIFAFANEPQSMTFKSNYDDNGDRDLISVATTHKNNEKEILFNLFKELSSINNTFNAFFNEIKLKKNEIEFFYFEFPKKLENKSK